MAVDRVGEEDATEKENFLNQENPHAKRGGFLLLVQRLVLPVQLSGAMHSVLLQLLRWRLRHRSTGLETRDYTNRKTQSSPCAGESFPGTFGFEPVKPKSGR